jgi:Histidine kinase-, DNA gyrase B-, and HSP90-like ATPase
MSATTKPSAAETKAGLAEVVPLRYVARAGLLPELTRQTYDSLYKALREAILNSVDAGATCVHIDLSAVETDRMLELRDDGSGMSLADLEQSFMSLGGSEKFGTADKFGRIGIGSLALMHYAEAVHIETKQSGSNLVTRAVVSHPWTLDQEQRAQSLTDLPAGEAWQETSARPLQDHYTLIRLEGVDNVLVQECADVGAYYHLVEQLRRILPLRWPQSKLHQELSIQAPKLVAAIQEHTSAFCANVVLRSRWSDDDVLAKRIYGDGGSQDEDWDGAPKPILRTLSIDDGADTRQVTLCGYLVSQVRPSTDWTGLVARVQNVAVEEHTFFDLESDPGFRKYITGEVWLLGDLDRTRLVNIDRASFSRESQDYRAIARTMQAEINEFKSEFVQAPRRAKVAIKRRLEQQVDLIRSVVHVAAASEDLRTPRQTGRRFPSSNNGTIRSAKSRALVDDLNEMGALVAVESGWSGGQRPYRLKVAHDGRRILVELAAELAQPEVRLGGNDYSLVLIEGRQVDPPVIVRNRPRELLFNIGSRCFSGEINPAVAQVVMALEIAYVLGDNSANDLYEGVLTLISERRTAPGPKHEAG